MKSILEELYHGNIRPDSRRYSQDSNFMQAVRLKNDILEKLNATLNDSQKELFQQYCDAQGEIKDISRYDTFVDALKFGFLFMLEISNIAGEE